MRKLLLAAAALLALAGRASAVGPDTSVWPMMRGNSVHNSSTVVSGTLLPKVSWRYYDGASNSRSSMSVVLGSNGVIYIGGRSVLSALNPDGTLKWTANEVPGGTNSWGTPAVGDNSRVYASTENSVYAYDTAGSGAVTYISSAAAGTASTNPGGAGAVMISQAGNVYVSHGDETFHPTSQNNANIYAYDSALTSLTSWITGGSYSSAGRSAVYFNYAQDKACVSGPTGGLDCNNPTTGAAANINAAALDTLQLRSEPGGSFRGDGSFVTTEYNSSSFCGTHGTSTDHFAAVSAAGALIWRKCDINLGSAFSFKFHTPVSGSSLNTYIGLNPSNTVYKFDNTGTTLWSYVAGSDGTSARADSLGPPTLSAGTSIYFTYCAGGPQTRLVALDASTGSSIWDVIVSTTACFSGQPVPAPGNRIFLYNGPEVIAFEESEAVAFTASTSAASFSIPVSNAIWYSTVTVAVTKAGGLAVSSGVIVDVRHFATSPAAVSAPTITPGATGFLLTDTAGLAKFIVKHEFTPSITANDLAAVNSTATFSTPGVASQTLYIKESRIASVSVATQTPAMGGATGSVRFSTLTFTVRDNLSAPLSGIPCVSRAAGTSYPGSTSMTAYPSQSVWATNGSGQAAIVFGDNISGLNNDSYAGYAVTHTVSCLGAPSQQVVMREHRVATVEISTGQASVEINGANYARISTVTVTLRDSLGAVVPGVPVALDYGASPAPITVTPSAVGFTTATNALGQASFFVQEFLQGVDPASYATMASTMTLRVLSFPDQIFALREERVATVTVATSPAVNVGGVRVVAGTVTVRDAQGALLPNIPVGVKSDNYSGVTTYLPGGISVARIYTNALGIATFTVRQDVLSASFSGLYSFAGFANFNSSQTISVPQRPDQTVGTRETRTASFTVTSSSTSLDSETRSVSMTVTVRDSLSNPVPNVPVAVSSYTRAGMSAFEKLSMDPGLDQNYAGAMTNASGQATFTLKLGTVQTDYDTFDGFTANVAFVPLGLPATTSFFLVEGNSLDHYEVTVPTFPISVGVAFVSTITAMNSYNHRLSSYTQSGINLIPLFAGTAVQGTGTLGTSVTGAFTAGRFQVSAQTYNKVEDIDIKASRSSDGKNGTSNTLTLQGPHHFIVTVPTSAQAGVPFSMTVRAVDASSTPVIGYAATLALSAYNGTNPALSGAGVLGITNVNMPANGVVTIANQTYTKAESIQIRASDTGASVVGQSTYSAVVGAGTPASITLLANPQSTIAGVPSVLTATIYDGYSNPVSNSTATFSVATGSGVVSLSLSNGSVVSAVTSTQAVTDSFGQTQAFFSSTNSLSAQANLLRASIGALARDTTVYSTVLVTSAGGAVVNFSNPLLRADIPANTYGFSVRLGIQGKAELAAADLALTTAAFAATANTFVSTTVLKLSAVQDSSPTTAAGAGSKLVTVSMPYTVTSGSISVGAYGAQSILVPLSVMRIFKLNQASSVFEQVIDGVTAVNSVTGVVTAEVSDPDGIYALGAPAFTNLTTGSSATVTTALAGGTTAEVVVPPGGFSSPATISVTVPGASAVPALPVRPGLTALGVTISVSAGGLQPATPVTIKIGYTLANIAGVNPDHLRLARYDATTGWVVLDSSADQATRQVIGTTDHFSLFQIVAQTPGASVSEGFVFPNPYRPSAGHTNIKLSSLPAGAHIKIFTATGRLLKELDADAAGQVLSWNGTDRDGRALASGVYLAVIEGTGGRRTIKFAVQR